MAPRALARAAAWAPALAWAALIFYLSAQSIPPEPPGLAAIPFRDKAEHLVEYGIFATLLLVALRRGAPALPAVPARLEPLAAGLVAAAYAATDEFHQSFVPLRQADVFDWLADSLGALLFAFALARFIRRPASGPSTPDSPAPPPPGA